MFADFALNWQWFAAIDSARPHDFGFNEAVSLLIPCESQKEIDALTPKPPPYRRPSSAAGRRTASA